MASLSALANLPENELAALTHALTGKRMEVTKVYNKTTKRGLRRWLADNPNPRKAVVIIADSFNISIYALLQHTRRTNISIVRMGAIYVLRRFELSLPEIGIVMDRDHSTIVHSLRVADKLLYECNLMEKLNMLIEQLESLLSKYRNRSTHGRRKNYFKAHNYLIQRHNATS